ncbi:Survival protein SurA precursor (Peptidyl-prolyl cis-trans isomerase SurA) [Fulvivirga imtechensis AK7]|uniref:Survival protein SurA (Peptidyl-prolyl cis-trans isomerase SurA) n=1 Tax=Fulvivirga imtechensis AK7 TaxID=1237149 RepID=L8JS00_9BACT|nr:peptidylprolyl isomerase [Fulvivirga imtechensis]ELR70993.1 Survival protein SurA precursor (Peptidyl-prolyl cis-trans isomerase SurA) [Fulvivirga imtechensis AK7]
MKYIISAIYIGLLGMAPIAGQSQQNGLVVDKIIAKVDNYIVLKSDLESTYLNYLASGNPATPEAKCRILAQLISQKLMVAKAEIDSVIVTDAEVDNNLDRRMQMILSQYGGSAEQLEEYYGKTIEEFQADIRDQVKEQLVVQRMQESITSGIKVTPSEVRKFFSKIPQDSLPYFSTEVEVAQVVKIPSVGRDEIAEAKRKLNEIRDKVLAGESFETLAKEYSQDPGSAKFGGNLGFAKRGMMAPEFEAAALKLKPNEISKPFETQFGVHIVQLLERRGNEYNSRHILLMAAPSQDDIKHATNYLDSIRSKILADSISFEKAAKEYSDDIYTAGNGGFFMDQVGGTRVSVEDLDPVVFFTIDSMKVGDISRPMNFRTDDGKEAVRILYYKSKVRPHQANLREDWQKIQAAALNEKKTKALNTWFNKAREDVFISIDKTYDHCGIMN